MKLSFQHISVKSLGSILEYEISKLEGADAEAGLGSYYACMRKHCLRFTHQIDSNLVYLMYVTSHLNGIGNIKDIIPKYDKYSQTC